MTKLKVLLDEVRQCRVCEKCLPMGPRPVLSAEESATILIIGQAPGIRVHKSRVPWDDPSGKRLRQWMDVSDETFYDPSKIAIVPMGFCYPGTGKSGDMPPRPECAPLWHQRILDQLPNIELILLIGQYAQKYYLRDKAYKTLTETVRNHQDYGPKFLPLPHPSPRNQFWIKKNPWFETDIIPILQKQTKTALK